jgi:hypothetical protein
VLFFWLIIALAHELVLSVYHGNCCAASSPLSIHTRVKHTVGGYVGGCTAAPSQVRKRLSIIPQEPVMFKGTVRSNLDPFGEASDNELWHALSLVHLKAAVAELPGGLDGPVTEGGSNFSLGQKQVRIRMCLLCSSCPCNAGKPQHSTSTAPATQDT